MTVLIRRQAAPQLFNTTQQRLPEIKPKLSNTVVLCVTNCSLIQEILKDMLELIQEKNLTVVLCAQNHLLSQVVSYLICEFILVRNLSSVLCALNHLLNQVI